MKREIITFTAVKSRNVIARDMMDRNGPYKPKVERNQKQYSRNGKYRKNFSDYSDRFYL